jgi:hypothetical protein
MIKNKLLISLGIIFLLASIVYAGTELIKENVAVSDKIQADRLGKVEATDYTCDAKTCEYIIIRAGATYERTFNSTADNQKAYDENKALWYEEMIAKIKPVSQEKTPTKELTPIQK